MKRPNMWGKAYVSSVRDVISTFTAMLVVLSLCAGGAALADQPDFPALFDVKGVASDDVLNVRANPNASAQIVGALRPQDANVEVITPNEAGDWGLVNINEGTGWVSLRFMQRVGQPLESVASLGQCFGTEPFWTVSFEGDSIRYSTPEGALNGTVVERLASRSRLDRAGIRLSLPTGPLDGVVAWRSCNDGMSDSVYGIAVDFLGPQGVISGCCSLSQ